MPIETNAWFDRVYNDPLYLDLYEREDDARADSEARGAMQLCAVPADGEWLDACCGFGRHAERFAKAGYRVVGVDRSPVLLRRAVARAFRAGLNLRYIRADLRRLPFTEQFECASLMFDSFGFFRHDHEHLEALLSLALGLRAHGRLLIQLTNRERLITQWRESVEEMRGAYRISKRRRLDLPQGRLSWQMQIEGPHVSREWALDLRLFTAVELRDLLERAGFDQIRFCGDWDGSPYGPESPLMIATARKAVFADLAPLDD